MGQIVSDNFNRADGTGLGANWTDVTGGFNIASNVASARAAAADNVSVFTGAGWTGGADQYSEAAAIIKDASRDMGTIARGASGAETGYFYIINDNDAGITLGSSMQTHLYKVSAGAFSLVGTATSLVINANDVVRIEAQGTTIRGLINGVQKCSGTDGGISSGNPGLWAFGATCAMDNWAAGDFSAGSTPFDWMKHGAIDYPDRYRRADVVPSGQFPGRGI
jgi:hypothetical protein